MVSKKPFQENTLNKNWAIKEQQDSFSKAKYLETSWQWKLPSFPPPQPCSAPLAENWLRHSRMISAIWVQDSVLSPYDPQKLILPPGPLSAHVREGLALGVYVPLVSTTLFFYGYVDT